MMNPLFEVKSTELFNQYNQVIKPLIAEIEARSEAMPQPLFNEIRAFTDHIARCYFPDITNEKLDDELQKAGRHVVRITLDCFKCLNILLFKKVEEFERQTKNVDLKVLDNGEFYPKYKKLKRDAAETVKQAKLAESKDSTEALKLYDAAYNKYVELEDLLKGSAENVKWARVHFTVKRILKITAWVVSVIVSGLLSLLISCDLVRELLLR